MSRWRRIALEELPWCKRDIEEARNSTEMWHVLGQEFEEALSRPAPGPEQARRILAFALLAERAGLSAWAFFAYVLRGFILGDSAMREHLPLLMPERDFERWIVGIADTSEEVAASRSAFYAARHRKK